MNSLRITLLILGLIFIGAVYLYETRWRRPQADEDEDALGQPSYLDDLSESHRSVSASHARRAQWPARSAGDRAVDGTAAIEESDVAALLDELDGFGSAEPDVPVDALGALSVHAPDAEQPDLDGLDFIVPRGADGGAVRKGMRGLRSLAAQGPHSGKRSVPHEGLIVALSVMARRHCRFAGTEIQAALESAGFQPAPTQIFHHFGTGGVPAQPLFSAVNVLNPGTFDLDRMGELTTPGLALFMRSAGEEGAVETFDAMVRTGEALAGRLDGELRDETRNKLTGQSINHMRDRVVEFCRQQRLERSSLT